MFENEFTWGKAVANNTTQQFDDKFDNAVEKVKSDLNKDYPIIINGKEIFLDKKFDVKSPSDTRITLATFPLADSQDTINAIKSARAAFSEWSNFSYQDRAKIFRECADQFSSQKFMLSAIMSLENGKTRIEAMGDIDEAIDFMRFYADQLEINKGFSRETKHPNPNEKTRTILKPYGVWGVIAPFNFPSAIAIGMTTGALITGNAAVLKPASDTPISSFKFAQAIYQKLPAGGINFVTGPGGVVGKTIIESPLVDGIAFTGSYDVGMSGFKSFTQKTPRPFVSEMGGKNPVIVSKSADLDKAADGVMRAAFGYGGQKCSACSRVYVQKDVAEKFLQKIVEKTNSLKIGFPWEKDVYLGPLINEAAQEKFRVSVDLAKKDGEVLTGGSVLKNSEYENGYYVQPTIVTKLPRDHKLIKEELFLPILCIDEYNTFDEAIKLANDSNYGLTAGIFSEDKKQLKEFFDKIEAGVVYANRAASATTAALVGSQPFVGWKDSGSSGRGAGGEHYLQQFMRTQTQTRCE
ncbi:MAG: aldehyde dehydrogenase family protein [Nitrosopumilaceae archaeon]